MEPIKKNILSEYYALVQIAGADEKKYITCFYDTDALPGAVMKTYITCVYDNAKKIFPYI